MLNCIWHDAGEMRRNSCLEPNGFYMYHHLNMLKTFILPTQCICMFCMYLRTVTIPVYLIGFRNLHGVCLLSGTNCFFKNNSLLTYVLKGLKMMSMYENMTRMK